MTAWPFAALGILPLAFFAVYVVGAFQQGRIAESLWMCHMCNLILALGIFANLPFVIGLAVLWIVLGVPAWAFGLWQTEEVKLISVVSHLGGLAVGLYAVSHTHMVGNPWLYALALYLVAQQLCRWITPAALNVNLAHQIYKGSPGRFGSYASYWATTTAIAALALWGIGYALASLFPPLPLAG